MLTTGNTNTLQLSLFQKNLEWNVYLLKGEVNKSPVTQSEKGTLSYQLQTVDYQTSYKLAPWCYEWERDFYHDFLHNHRENPKLSHLLRSFPCGFTVEQAAEQHIDRSTLGTWYLDGYLAPAAD